MSRAAALDVLRAYQLATEGGAAVFNSLRAPEDRIIVSSQLHSAAFDGGVLRCAAVSYLKNMIGNCEITFRDSIGDTLSATRCVGDILNSCPIPMFLQHAAVVDLDITGGAPLYYLGTTINSGIAYCTTTDNLTTTIKGRIRYSSNFDNLGTAFNSGAGDSAI